MTDFLHDAEYQTESWKRRHSTEAIAQLGVWRWKGMQQHAETILGLICGKRVIDFGGADGPLGFGSIVVDQKAEYKTLGDVPGKVDVIFTSHTLEHLDDSQSWLESAIKRLETGGWLIAFVPAWTCDRWRKGQYHNPNQAECHKHTFCLCTDMQGIRGTEDEWWDRIDSMACLAGFNIELAEYCGDDSILVIARKP